MRKFITIAGLALLVLGYCPGAAAQASWVATEYRNGDFKLVSGAHAADLLVLSLIHI